MLELALREALSLGHNYIGTEHILLGLAREGEGVAMRVLVDCGADSEKIRNEVIRMLSGGGAPGRAAGSATASGSESRVVGGGWLGDLGGLLGRLGQEIRAELGREPDPGDLLVVLACAPGTPAAQALGELGVDVDQLWARIEHARGRARAAREVLAQRIREVAQAKDRAIEDQRFEEASALRDQERQLREQTGVRPRLAPEVCDEIRRRLGIPGPTTTTTATATATAGDSPRQAPTSGGSQELGRPCSQPQVRVRRPFESVADPSQDQADRPAPIGQPVDRGAVGQRARGPRADRSGAKSTSCGLPARAGSARNTVNSVVAATDLGRGAAR